MPITACVARPWLRVSTRIPPSFAPFTTRSLGHLSAACATPSARSARATATPATSDRPATSRTGRCRLRESENVRPAPGALRQRRPRRPRPAVCSSAASNTGPVQGAFNKTEFVEVQRPNTRTWTPGTAIAAGSRRSMARSLREWLLYTPARHALAVSENRRPPRRRVACPREHARRNSARGVARLPRRRVRRHAGRRRHAGPDPRRDARAHDRSQRRGRADAVPGPREARYPALSGCGPALPRARGLGERRDQARPGAFARHGRSRRGHGERALARRAAAAGAVVFLERRARSRPGSGPGSAARSPRG